MLKPLTLQAPWNFSLKQVKNQLHISLGLHMYGYSTSIFTKKFAGLKAPL
jgi:hypothetical protein